MNELTPSETGRERHEPAPADPLWAERWKRLAAANDAARRERLRSLTLEGALREFEALCREVHAAFDKPRMERPHPVGLIKYTRRERAKR